MHSTTPPTGYSTAAAKRPPFIATSPGSKPHLHGPSRSGTIKRFQGSGHTSKGESYGQGTSRSRRGDPTADPPASRLSLTGRQAIRVDGDRAADGRARLLEQPGEGPGGGRPTEVAQGRCPSRWRRRSRPADDLGAMIEMAEEDDGLRGRGAAGTRSARSGASTSSRSRPC